MISRKIALLIAALCLSATTTAAWQRKDTCNTQAKPDRIVSYSLILGTLCQEGWSKEEASTLPAKEQKKNPAVSLESARLSC